MSSTTQKYRDFIARPIEGRPVTAVPGIGQAYDERLSQFGYHMVSSGLLRRYQWPSSHNTHHTVGYCRRCRLGLQKEWHFGK